MSANWEPYQFTCSMCGEVMDERIETVWNEVVGWEKKRDQGGTNHIALRRPRNKFMCNKCMTRLLAGLNAGQESLWSSIDA